MRVTLTQTHDQSILNRWILLRIETNHVCTQVWTSAILDPYRELYIWLGKIRDAQLPARVIINEEGGGVELVAGRVDDEFLCFHIEPWLRGNDNLTRLSVTLKSDELVGAFCEGIFAFIRDDYVPKAWAYTDHLSNLNWSLLLQSASLPAKKWNSRLAIYGSHHKKESNADREGLIQTLTPEQQWLVILYDVLDKIVQTAVSGHIYTSYSFAHLYQNLLADLVLDEIDAEWYEKRRSEIDKEFENSQRSRCPPTSKGVRIETRTRLLTLKLGQLVDGRVSKIKPYGVFVDIAGCYALLSIFKISQTPITHPKQVFQVDDWVRAIIVSLDIEKGTVLLATSDLEAEPGDMLRDPLHVYEHAEKMAESYQTYLLSRQME